MASRSAAWVRGPARLISSARTIWAKSGPRPVLEIGRPLVEEADPGDVAGQQVGRELDALE